MEEIVRLYIEPSRHGVDIADVFFSPGDEVQSGQTYLALYYRTLVTTMKKM